MKTLVKNVTVSGRGFCGHMIYKGENHIIMDDGRRREARAYCPDCGNRMFGDLPVNKRIQGKDSRELFAEDFTGGKK